MSPSVFQISHLGPVFIKFGYPEQSSQLYSKTCSLHDAYGGHIYDTAFPRGTDVITIKKMNSTFGRMARFVLFGDPKLCPWTIKLIYLLLCNWFILFCYAIDLCCFVMQLIYSVLLCISFLLFWYAIHLFYFDMQFIYSVLLCNWFNLFYVFLKIVKDWFIP